MGWHALYTGGWAKSSAWAKENAVEIYRVLGNRGWTVNAVSGLLGSIDVESGYNPLRWEGDVIRTPSNTELKGYGLVQFTPNGKYILSSIARAYPEYNPNYSGHTGTAIDGEAQMKFVDEHADYYPTSKYPLTYAQYKASTKSPRYLARAWVYNYERPADPSATIQHRQDTADYWYEYLSGNPPPPEPTERKKMPLWFYLRPF